MKEYNSFENVRDALRCLNEYFTHPFDKYIYLVVDKQEGEAAITHDPSYVVKQWIVDYEYNLSCLEDIEVYEYRKVEDDSIGWNVLIIGNAVVLKAISELRVK